MHAFISHVLIHCPGHQDSPTFFKHPCISAETFLTEPPLPPPAETNGPAVPHPLQLLLSPTEVKTHVLLCSPMGPHYT